MKIKICGLRSIEAARTAKESGADFLGFILWPNSRRYIASEEAARIVRAVRGNVMTVGVVVEEHEIAPPGFTVRFQPDPAKG